jgi:hypothetical protein
VLQPELKIYKQYPVMTKRKPVLDIFANVLKMIYTHEFRIPFGSDYSWEDFWVSL